MKSIVVAFDKNYGIGANGDLLWQRDLPADLRHFKDLTMGGTLIMGRKTFESIGRALPGRQNIVISRQNPTGVEGVITAHSPEVAYALAQFPIFIIGGGEIYKQTIDDADRIYATEIDASFPQATVFFPAIDPKLWHETMREHHDTDGRNKYTYDFVTYERSGETHELR